VCCYTTHIHTHNYMRHVLFSKIAEFNSHQINLTFPYSLFWLTHSIFSSLLCFLLLVSFILVALPCSKHKSLKQKAHKYKSCPTRCYDFIRDSLISLFRNKKTYFIFSHSYWATLHREKKNEEKWMKEEKSFLEGKARISFVLFHSIPSQYNISSFYIFAASLACRDAIESKMNWSETSIWEIKLI
jgi:hypothetical protein